MVGFMAYGGEYSVALIIVERQSRYTATIGQVRQMTAGALRDA